jgi:DUF1009 family protein
VRFKRIALIAGGGELPLIFLRNAEKKGQDVLVFEIQGEGNPGLSAFKFDRIKIKLAHLEEMIKISAQKAIKHVMFLGYVRPENLLKDIVFDERTRKTFFSLKDKSAKSLMESAIAEFEKDGIKTLPTTYLMDEVLSPSGYLTKVKPDINEFMYAVNSARSLAHLDVGQTVVAASGMIWAVEAMEGTDNCIRRGAKLSKQPFVVVKMARPEQDIRYDIPAIGLRTIKLVKSLGGRGIIAEAGRTFLLNKEELLRYADDNKLFIYGWRKSK